MTRAGGERILVVGPAWVGDAIMAQSLYMTLRAQSPHAWIAVLAPAPAHALLARMPEVDEAIESPFRHGELRMGARRRFGHSLRARFDLAIVLPGSFKSALAPWFAKIPRRRGYVGEQRFGVLNQRHRLDARVLPQNVQRFVALAKDAPPKVAPPIPQPALTVDSERAAALRARLNLNDDAPVVALCPGAEYGAAKRWPPAHFAEVAKAMLQKGAQVWLLGGDNDAPATAAINQLCDNACRDLAGKTSLGEALDLLACARDVVTNDSGLMHAAAAVGARVIALYGSSSDAFTPPLTARAHRLGLDLPCRPCFARECPLGHLDCLNRLKPERVLALLG